MHTVHVCPYVCLRVFLPICLSLSLCPDRTCAKKLHISSSWFDTISPLRNTDCCERMMPMKPHGMTRPCAREGGEGARFQLLPRFERHEIRTTRVPAQRVVARGLCFEYG
jgi:hypothetical protein